MIRATHEASGKAGPGKRATSPSFRQSFATPLREAGQDLRTMRELLRYAEVSTTMIDTDVRNRGGQGMRRPRDRLAGPGP